MKKIGKILILIFYIKAVVLEQLLFWLKGFKKYGKIYLCEL